MLLASYTVVKVVECGQSVVKCGGVRWREVECGGRWSVEGNEHTSTLINIPPY
jgi:hypothetical protein